jgi:dTDP-4-amino-4,6-dideoxygalactose transaminase
MEIKYLDLNAQYQSIKSEIDSAIQNVINSSAFASGPAVKEFEENFADYCDVQYCSGVNSGTNALLLALKAMNVGNGDEVITTANTFVATISAIIQAGAKPVLVDVDPVSRNIDPLLLKMAISNKTRVIIPVHLYGRMADMDQIIKIANENGINVLEDAAQAHGAKYKEKQAGSIGKAATFSFYPGKNLGAYGEGGAVVTNDRNIDKMIKMLRDHGSEKKYFHEMTGYNARMDGIQGAVLNVKLNHLEKWNQRRRVIAKLYSENLQNVAKPNIENDYEQVFHLYVIEHEKRDELQQYLKEKYNIPTLIHYPIPNHLQKGYEFLGYKNGDFPVTEKLSNEVLSLPIYPEMTDEQVLFVADNINEFTG